MERMDSNHHRPKPPEGTTVLYLVRHGATEANERRPYILQGNGIDLPLSPSGKQQVTHLAEFLKPFPLTKIYSSTMLRARQTAAEIAGKVGIVPESLDGLQECDVGKWEGMSWEEIQSKYPDYSRNFLEDPASVAYLGGESYSDVLNRVNPILQGLLEQHRGESIAVVAHNVVNRVYLAGLLGLDLKLAKDLRQQNTCINVISCAGKPTVVTMNATFHLPGLSL